MRLLASASPGLVRVAAVEGDQLIDLATDRLAAPGGVGDLHRGRIAAHMPNMAGAFVKLATGADGFLPDSEGGKQPEGTMLGVRVTRAPQGGKGPRLSAKLTDDERALLGTGQLGAGKPALLRRGPGAVERLAACYPQADILLDDAALLAALRPSLGTRLALTARAFDAALADEIDALAEPVAELGHGARMSVHPTPALTAIDIDLGAGESGGGKAHAQKRANLTLIPAIAHQIRLRNLSGAILLDFGGMAMSARKQLAAPLAEALGRDPLKPRLLGFTALGLAEIVRPRVHPPLHEVLTGPHAAALRALRLVVMQHAATPSWRPALRAAADVATAIAADAVALADVPRRTGSDLTLATDPTLPPGSFALEG